MGSTDNDRIGGGRTVISGGSGNDTVVADQIDIVSRDCEKV
jgi:hypothetical protein